MTSLDRALPRGIRVGAVWNALLAMPLAAQEPAERPRSVDSVTVLDSLERLIKRTVTVSGYVRDTAGRTLPHAEVRVERGGRVVSTLSEDDGSFFLRGAPPDSATLVVRRVGYHPVEVLLTVKAGLQIDLAINMTPLAVTLGTIVVEGQRVNLHLMKSGFYDRQRHGFGTLFGPDYLQYFGGSVSGLLTSVPGVYLHRDMYGRATAKGRNGISECPLNVFVDGVRAPWVQEFGMDQALNRADILAVEVYPRYTQLPTVLSGRASVGSSADFISGMNSIQMHGAGTPQCGAIVIWLKTYEDRLADRNR